MTVRTYYSGFGASRSSLRKYELERLVVDDHCAVTEDFLKQIYPGAH
ncbi:hypothetical protein [Nocardia sp. NPDC060249]